AIRDPGAACGCGATEKKRGQAAAFFLSALFFLLSRCLTPQSPHPEERSRSERVSKDGQHPQAASHRPPSSFETRRTKTCAAPQDEGGVTSLRHHWRPLGARKKLLHLRLDAVLAHLVEPDLVDARILVLVLDLVAAFLD